MIVVENTFNDIKVYIKGNQEEIAQEYLELIRYMKRKHRIIDWVVNEEIKGDHENEEERK